MGLIRKDEFTKWLSSKGLRKSTMQQYIKLLEKTEILVGNIDVATAKDINFKLYQSGKSPKTIHLVTCALRKYLKFADRKAEMGLIEKPEKYKSSPRKVFILPAEIKKLESACLTDEERLIIKLPFTTGIRRGVLATLCAKNAKTGKITVEANVIGNKAGEKYATIELSPDTQILIQKVIDDNKLGDSSLLLKKIFMDYGIKSEKQRAEFVTNHVIRIGKRAGVKVTPHVLRHTFGTYHYTKFHDIIRLRDLMGQKTTAATERYIHLSKELEKQLGMSNEKEEWLNFIKDIVR